MPRWQPILCSAEPPTSQLPTTSRQGRAIQGVCILSKMSKLLTVVVVALVIAGCLSFAAIPSLRHHCKVSCNAGGLLADKFGFCGGQYLLYLVNCLIPLLEHTGGGCLEVVVQGVQDYNNCNAVLDVSIWRDCWLQALHQESNVGEYIPIDFISCSRHYFIHHAQLYLTCQEEDHRADPAKRWCRPGSRESRHGPSPQELEPSSETLEAWGGTPSAPRHAKLQGDNGRCSRGGHLHLQPHPISGCLEIAQHDDHGTSLVWYGRNWDISGVRGDVKAFPPPQV